MINAQNNPEVKPLEHELRLSRKHTSNMASDSANSVHSQTLEKLFTDFHQFKVAKSVQGEHEKLKSHLKS